MSNEEVLQHFGVKGMRWGVRRNLAKQGYNKKQIKYMNEQYKKEHEFGQRAGENNKTASKAVAKGKIGIEISGDLATGAKRRGLLARTPVITGIPKKKIEAALGRPLSDFPYRNRRKVQKLIAKYGSVNVRTVTNANIDNSHVGWKKLG